MKICLIICLVVKLVVQQIAAQSQPCFSLPLKQLSVNSSYGWRHHPLTGYLRFHQAVDLRAAAETVLAVLPGVICAARYTGSLGIHLVIDHGYGLTSLYGHLSAVTVKTGDIVRCGQPVAITGNTGRVTGEHLHFAFSFLGQPIDPLRTLLSLSRPP